MWILSELGWGAYAAMAAIAGVLVTLAVGIARLSRSRGEDRDMLVFLLTVGPAVLVGVIAMAYLVATLLWIDEGEAPLPRDLGAAPQPTAPPNSPN